MARTITKKAFDDDLMLSDDFDESVLDKIEKRLDTGAGPAGMDDIPLPGSGSSGQNQLGSFSLDDFETESVEETGAQWESDLQQPASGKAKDREGKPKASGGLSGWTMQLIPMLKLGGIVAVGGLLVFVAVFLVAGLVYAPRERLPIVTTIRHTVPVPVSTEVHEFLIRANSDKGSTLVNMGIELRFYGATSEGRPREEQIAFRDIIYRFLSDEQPPKNSQRYWEKIVLNDLQPYLKTTLPKKGLKSVRLIRFARL